MTKPKEPSREDLFNSLDWIKRELFKVNDLMTSVLTNQKQLEDTMLQLLREYREIRKMETVLRKKPKS